MFSARIDLKTGRDLALGRIGLAVAALVISITDPDKIGFEIENDDLAALGFLAVSLAMVWVAVQSWWWQFKLRYAEIVLDLAMILAFVFLNDSSGMGKHVLEVLTLSFACFRIGLTARIGYIYAIAAAYLIIFVLLAQGPFLSHLDPHPPFLIMRTLAIVALCGMIITAMLNNRIVARILVPPPPTGIGTGLFIGAASQAAKQALAATWTRIDWQSNEAASLVGSLDQAWPFPQIDRNQVAAMVFDPLRNRALVLNGDGTTLACRNPAVVQAALPANEGTMIFAPIKAASGSGLICASGVPQIHPLSLEPIRQMAETLAVAADLNDLAYIDRQTDLSALRQSIALDLHDSVAQSLAGARFWLKGIAGNLADRNAAGDLSELASSIDTLTESLAFEQSHVHTIISRLRDGESALGLVDVQAELQQLAHKLSVNWRTTVDVAVQANAAILPVNDTHEAKHLIREAVANAVRHGNASRIGILVDCSDSAIIVAVSDNGTGFAADNPGQAPWSIRARLDQLGGAVRVASSPAGVRLEMTFPSGVG